MNAQEITSRLTDLGRCSGAGRVNRVTLGLLLKEHLSVNATMARTSAYRRLEQQITGLSSAVKDLEQAELISVARLSAEATGQMLLTTIATTLGYLDGSGADRRFGLSYHRKIVAILCTSEGRLLHDEVVFTIKRERARTLTSWALGDGKCRADTTLATLWQVLWLVENNLRAGYRLMSEIGSGTEALLTPSRPWKNAGGTPIADRTRLTRPV